MFLPFFPCECNNDVMTGSPPFVLWGEGEEEERRGGEKEVKREVPSFHDLCTVRIFLSFVSRFKMFQANNIYIFFVSSD